MTPDITPGTYRNTNTGAHFQITVDEDEGEVTFKDGEGETAVEFTRDATDFWFNTLDCTGPTYELVEAADTSEPTDTVEQTDTAPNTA